MLPASAMPYSMERKDTRRKRLESEGWVLLMCLWSSGLPSGTGTIQRASPRDQTCSTWKVSRKKQNPEMFDACIYSKMLPFLTRKTFAKKRGVHNSINRTNRMLNAAYLLFDLAIVYEQVCRVSVPCSNTIALTCRYSQRRQYGTFKLSRTSFQFPTHDYPS